MHAADVCAVAFDGGYNDAVAVGVDAILVIGCRVMTSLDMFYSLTGKLLRCNVGAVSLRRQ